MNRWDIINLLIEKNNYKSYLEIGYYKGWSFDQVICKSRSAVDPNPCKTEEQQMSPHGKSMGSTSIGWIMKKTSDEFFESLDYTLKWDLIFIDGLHEASQVERDIRNALNHLSPQGTIVLHDCNPPAYQHTTCGIDGCWTGDTYKAFVKFRFQYPEYESFTVDTDWGCGIILTPMTHLTWIDMTTEDISPRYTPWEKFDKDRKDLLNLISIEEFINKTNERTKNTDVPA